jgi:hypothetical protein
LRTLSLIPGTLTDVSKVPAGRADTVRTTMPDQDATSSEERGFPAFDRRRGPRRVGEDGEVAVERRGPDRRKRKPGIAGLFGAIFGHGPKEDLDLTER